MNRILILVNWEVNQLTRDDTALQSPDKQVGSKPYWFFKYWPVRSLHVDVIDTSSMKCIQHAEKNVLKFYIVQALKCFHRTFRYDVIISHGAQSAVSLALMRTLFGSRYPPHIVIDVGCFNGGRNDPIELFAIKAVSHSIRGIIYHSTVQQAYYSRHLPHIRSGFIPFGVDTEHFEPKAGSSGNEKTIIAFGNKKRDYRTLCDAWRILNTDEYGLHIVGIGSRHQLCVDSVPKGITIHAEVPISVLKKMIGKAAFVVLPLPVYNYAYGQMSLLQSMSMGKAVIVTKTPSTIDYVRDNVDAVFTRPYDSGDLSKRMAAFIINPGLVDTIGKNAYSIVRRRYNERKMSLQIYDFIREVTR